jgi:sugar phosphate isomerase/epimerase
MIDQRCDSMYRVALSTMWAMKRDEPFPLFFQMARRLGFSHHELNHAVTPEMLATVDPRDLRVASIHEPCPCPLSRLERLNRGVQLTSLDESLRGQAVEYVRGSIRLAHRLGSRAVVVHPGEIPGGRELERRLKALRSAGKVDTTEATRLRAEFAEMRAAAAPQHIVALHRSLLELADEAEQLGVRLGMENRDHYYEVPLPDELDELLALRPGVIEYWHDTGHGEILESLGFVPHREWLERFGDRMIGIHLHDFDGEQDHIAPGLGAIDWEWIGGFIPDGAIRTFEIRGFSTPEQIRSAQELLHRTECIEQVDG